MREWQTGKPPHRVLVEVEAEDGSIWRVKAVLGSDGYRPHWRTDSGDHQWEPSFFRRWREIGGQG